MDRTEDAWSVVGPIRVMADYLGLPLWDDEGRLPEEHEFVHDFLGLSRALVADLVAWSDHIETHRDASVRDVNAQGNVLTERLRVELGGRHEVVFVPQR